MFCIFIDYQEVYSNVVIVKMKEILEKESPKIQTQSENEINRIKLLLKYFKIKVVRQNIYKKKSETQGGELNPLTFNIILNTLKKYLKEI